MIATDVPRGRTRTAARSLERAHSAAGGLGFDLGLYAVGLLFATVTAVASTLPAHRAWGAVATAGYAGATVAVIAMLAARRGGLAAGRLTTARAAVAAMTWALTALLPLVAQAVARAGGAPGRAQEEVAVTELAGSRLLATGTPYLDRGQIADRLADLGLLAYVPYQPGMAVLGLPRAVFGDTWWTDARVVFALVTGAALGAALVTLWRAGVPGDRLIRAAQAVTVLPVCALTLATGGDDIPVLALCLLAFALAYCGRFAGAGVAIGAGAALKLFAWPVAVVLGVYALTRGRRVAAIYAVGAFGVPAAVLVPITLRAPDAVVENLLRFPVGLGLVASPAASPFPGRLLAVAVPYGRELAVALLVATAAAIGLALARRPPRDPAGVALLCSGGLLAAIMLMPATRFGYLLYPTAYGIWAFVLHRRDGSRRYESRPAGKERRQEV